MSTDYKELIIRSISRINNLEKKRTDNNTERIDLIIQNERQHIQNLLILINGSRKP